MQNQQTQQKLSANTGEITGRMPVPLGGRQTTDRKPVPLSYTFSRGARGFLVARLQTSLGITADGIFGRDTQARVRGHQEEQNRAPNGHAGPAEFHAAGLPWPTGFERCMNLVSNFEGTSFGDCNSTDIDGAGLTMGIAGFTSKHGEVQLLLAQYFAARPGQIESLLPAHAQQELMELLASQALHRLWRALFFGSSGRVKSTWRQAFAAMGKDPCMKHLQLTMARERFWNRAAATANRLNFRSLRARCFFLDVAVQNGGWRKQHEKHAQRDARWHSSDEPARLAAAAHAVAKCAIRRWQNDVLQRKLAIAKGSGKVHGRQWNLAHHGLK